MVFELLGMELENETSIAPQNWSPPTIICELTVLLTAFGMTKQSPAFVSERLVAYPQQKLLLCDQSFESLNNFVIIDLKNYLRHTILTAQGQIVCCLISTTFRLPRYLATVLFFHNKVVPSIIQAQKESLKVLIKMEERNWQIKSKIFASGWNIALSSKILKENAVIIF